MTAYAGKQTLANVCLILKADGLIDVMIIKNIVNYDSSSLNDTHIYNLIGTDCHALYRIGIIALS